MKRFTMISLLLAVALGTAGCSGKWFFKGKKTSDDWEVEGGIEGTFSVEDEWDGNAISKTIARNYATQEITNAIRTYGSPFVVVTDWSSLDVSVSGNEISYSLGGGASGSPFAVTVGLGLASLFFDVQVDWVTDHPSDIDIPTADR